MARYAVVIYHHDSAHAPDSTPDDREAATATPTISATLAGWWRPMP